MENLYTDLIKLLIENYFGIKDSLALFCVSRKLATYGPLYRETLLDAKRGTDYCIKNGKLASCKLIYRCYSMDIHENHELRFRMSCFYGHLEFVQWLYQLSREICSPIDIHTSYEWGFRFSCYNGHLTVAKWLYCLGQEICSPINIHINCEAPFRWSGERDHLAIVQWLCQVGQENNSPIDLNNCHQMMHVLETKFGPKVTEWLSGLGY